MLNASQVMEGVPALLHDVQVEATFPDGTKLVTVHEPVQPDTDAETAETIPPGFIATQEGMITLNEGRATQRVVVANTGDRPIQVGSHYHFFEVNPALEFDRALARGFRLDIAAGTAIRFEPGQSRTVMLVALDGHRRVYGFNQEIMGAL